MGNTFTINMVLLQIILIFLLPTTRHSTLVAHAQGEVLWFLCPSQKKIQVRCDWRYVYLLSVVSSLASEFKYAANQLTCVNQMRQHFEM